MREAIVSNIQRFSTEDGPGIRTTVFFKGCPMRCPWCHNPECIHKPPHLVWYPVRCIGCKSCEGICENHALLHEKAGVGINRDLCEACGACADECPAIALEIIGKRYSPDALAREALKDITFYETSRGGVTCSGGEPMVYLPFLEEFLPKLREKGVHVALDTCGSASIQAYDRVIPLVDLFLLDIKVMDPVKHKAFTGIPLERVLEAARHIHASGKTLWVRTPMIPGFTDDRENVLSIARFIRDELPRTERFDLLAFSNLCSAKYAQLGWKWALEGAALLAKADLAEMRAAVEDFGLRQVKTSGPTRLERPD